MILIHFPLKLFQEKFAKTIQYFPEIVATSGRILKAARMLDVPVIVTEQYPKGNDVIFALSARFLI